MRSISNLYNKKEREIIQNGMLVVNNAGTYSGKMYLLPVIKLFL